MTNKQLPEFKPDIPPHLLDDLDPKDRWLHEQLSVTAQLVRHVATEQVEGAEERKQLLASVGLVQKQIADGNTAFVQHTIADATVFKSQEEWQRKCDANFAALKWLRFDTYFNSKNAQKIVLAILTAAAVALAMQHWSLK